ncbi:MAG: hypothetical protein HY819_17945 [Acidobacteria bacterium]|nr:hypothetical protein [Acidobacteriota bacterium]
MLLLPIIRTQIYKLIILSIFVAILSHFASKEVLAQTAPDFSISVSPPVATIQAGSSVSFTISVTKQGPFNATVNFSGGSANGISVSFSPNSLNPPGNVTMTVSVTSSTAPGNYTVNISASGGQLTRSASVTITVPQQNFTLTASPSTLQVTPGTNAVFNVSANTATGARLNVSLNANSQLNVTFGNSTITTPGTTNMTVSVPPDTIARSYVVNIVASSPGSVAQTTSVTVDVRPLPDFMLNLIPGSISLPAGEQTELVVSVLGLNRFEGTVNLKVESELTAFLGSNSISGSGTSSLSISTSRSTVPKNYPVTIIGTSSIGGGVVEKRATAMVSVTTAPDFTLMLNPANLETSPGKPVSFSVGVNALNRFSDIVVLSFNTSNPNITATSSVPGIAPGSLANINVNVSANTLAGNYDINVIGMANGLQRTAIFRLVVKNDFDLVLNPTSQSITVGQKASFTVGINPRDGFNEQVALTASSPQNLIQVSLSANTIGISTTSTITLTTSPTTEPKDYLITISATGGGITKTATFNLTVKPNLGDFTLAVRPNQQSVSAGKATSLNLDIQGQNGFSDLVALRAEVAETSIQIGFAPSSAKPGDNVSITITTANTTAPGNYNIRVIGTSGALIKTADFVLTVTPAPQEAFSLAIAPNTQDIVVGDAAMFTIGVVGRNGFNQTVELSASSPDPNIQINFAKSSLTPGANTSITAVTNSNTPAGTYSIMVMGKAGSVVVTQPITLIARVSALQVLISFDPPQTGAIAPPQNVKVLAVELKNPSKAQELRKIHTLADSDIAGFKLYRLPQPAEGQPQLTEKDLVKDENLVATLGANDTSFVDRVNTSKSSSNNFVYSVSTFFGNGQNSSGSQPTGTNLPVIKNPVFLKGTILVDSPDSFIQMGAVIIVNGMDEYPLMFDTTGTRFTVAKKKGGSITGKTLKKLITKGVTVQLTIKNPDGKLSIARSLTRAK